MRKVLIGVPTYTGTVNVWFANSLVETCKLGLSKDINIYPIFLAFEKLVQRAKNKLMSIAFETEVDDLVFIDPNLEWEPSDFFKLLDHEVDLVGVPVKIGNNNSYNVSIPFDFDKSLYNGLVEVDFIGSEFLRLTKNCIQQLWNNSESYNELDLKLIFDINNQFIASTEDFKFIEKWKDLKNKVYIDPDIKINSVIPTKINSNFCLSSYLKN